MSKFSSVSLAVLALFVGSSAYAADINGGSAKDTGIFGDAPKNVNWSGVYIGGAVGYGHANHELTLEQYNTAYCYNRVGSGTALPTGFDPTVPTGDNGIFGDSSRAIPTTGCVDAAGDDAGDEATIDASSRGIAALDGLNSSGLVGDVRLGADLQRGRFVFGVFGTYGFNDMTTSGNIGDDISFGIEKGDEWSLGARAGLLVNNRTLAYILAAYTQSEFEFGGRIGDESASKSVDFSGITVGGGVEFAVTNNVFLGIEGTHTFYGEETLWDSNDGEDIFGNRLNNEIGETKVMGTLKVKLNSGLPSLSD